MEELTRVQKTLLLQETVAAWRQQQQQHNSSSCSSNKEKRISLEDDKIKLSPYQVQILNHFNGDKPLPHLLVNACAGSSKSTTQCEIIARLPRESKKLYLVFNKANQEQMVEKLKNCENCTIQTFNSTGFSLLKQAYRCTSFGPPLYDRAKTLIRSYFLEEKQPENWQKDDIDRISVLTTLFSHCMTGALDFYHDEQLKAFFQSNLTYFPGLLDFDSVWSEVQLRWLVPQKLDELSMVYGETLKLHDILKTLHQEYLDWCTEEGQWGFDDQIYVPVVKNLRLAPSSLYDYIFVDEAQDLNPLQIRLLWYNLKSANTVITIMGDTHQSIYSFRGSCGDTIKQLAALMNPVVMDLPQSFRCPTEVVAFVNQQLPHIDISAVEIAIKGSVVETEDETLFQGQLLFENEDLFMCATNAPLLEFLLKYTKTMNLRAAAAVAVVSTVTTLKPNPIFWQKPIPEPLPPRVHFKFKKALEIKKNILKTLNFNLYRGSGKNNRLDTILKQMKTRRDRRGGVGGAIIPTDGFSEHSDEEECILNIIEYDAAIVNVVLSSAKGDKEKEKTLFYDQFSKTLDLLIEKPDKKSKTVVATTTSPLLSSKKRKRVAESSLDRPIVVVRLQTIHMSKGDEAPRAFLYKPSTLSFWTNAEQKNLKYVAYTRAKKTLFIVNTKK